MRRVQYIITLLLVGVLMLGAIAPVTAASQTPSAEGTPAPEVDSGPKFILRPIDGQDGGFFTVQAKPGTTTDLTAVLGNAGTQPIDLRTFSSDAVNLVNGGFGIKEEEDTRTGPTTWIDWEAETFSFEPGEGIERTFSVTIPEDTPPGQYIAGISLQTAEPIEIQGSTMFNQIIRKAVAVFIVVEGDTTASFELGEPEIVTTTGGSRLEVPVTNSGDVLVKPAGAVTLTTADGREVFSADIAMGSVYANLEGTLLAIPLDNSLAGQEYELSLNLVDEATGVEATLEPQQILFTGEIPEEAPLQLAQSAIVPMPDAQDPVYASVDLTITNTGEVLSNANVVLHVYHDGTPVEDFALGTNMTIANGETPISQRYIPADGFSGGEWTFELSIEAVTPQTNATTVMLDQPLTDSIVVP